MPAQHIPVTPSVLRWAINESGLGPERIAERVGVSAEDIASWQRGSGSPTKGQFTALAQVLRRPSALFFLDEPPVYASVEVSLRAAFGDLKRDLAPEERNLIRYAKGVQTITQWSGLDSAFERVATSEFTDNPEVVSGDLRKTLGIRPFQQQSWPDPMTAFDKWRGALEGIGVIVLQLDLGPKAVRGFSIASRETPVVAVNTSYSPQVRIFTLFHEVAHLLTNSSSACVGFAAPARHVNRIERWCERFAASFLLPAANVTAFIEQHRPRHDTLGLDEVRALSKSFHVSARAAAIRLIDLGLAESSLYAAVDAHWLPFERTDKRGGRGTLTPLKRFRQVGRRVASGIRSAVHSGHINELDALRYLDLTLGEYEDFSELTAKS